MFQTVNLNENSIIGEANQSRVSNENDPNESNIEKGDRQSQKPRDITVRMLIRDFLLCVTLALTTYGALHNIPPKILRHPQPTRFFSTSSHVKDWYRGDIKSAFNDINRHDVSFVMYYAPWDAESQHVRHYLETAADVLKDVVNFAAVNCWEPTGECRKQNKILTWPILMSYTGAYKAVLYQGPQDPHSIVHFLDLMIRPLTKISSTPDLVNLLATCDILVVGFTPLNETNRYYNMFHTVSLKIKTVDHEGIICFGAVTSARLAESFGIVKLPAIRLMTYNSSLDYNWDVNITSDMPISKWILAHAEIPAARIVPTWQKSTSFDRHLSETTPMMLLFTPLNAIYPQEPAFDLLKEVAIEYNYCKENAWSQELMKLQRVQRQLYQQSNIEEYCSNISTKVITQKTILSSAKEKLWHNISNSKEKGEGFFRKLLDIESSLAKGTRGSPFYFGECENSFFNIDSKFRQCDSKFETLYDYDVAIQSDTFNGDELDEEADHLSAKNLITQHVIYFCNLINFAQTRGKQVHIPRSKETSSVEGLGCTTNSTLNFLAMDSIKSHHFAESLGINLEMKKDMTTAVILDSKTETQYVLEKDYNEHSIREFIANFTSGLLTRTLRSALDGKHTHSYGTGDSEILELNSTSFVELVTTKGTLRVVLICTASCPARVTLAAKSALRALRSAYGGNHASTVVMGRLDFQIHDLPWQYAPAVLPAIMVISRENQWRSYPVEERISSEGILALISSVTSYAKALRISLAAANLTRGYRAKLAIQKDMRETVSNLIHKSLRQWRLNANVARRQLLMKRFQLLRALSLELELSNPNNLAPNTITFKNLVGLLDKLDRNWRLRASAYDNLLEHVVSNKKL